MKRQPHASHQRHEKRYIAKVLGEPDLNANTVEVVVSTNTVDRHGEVILHEAWEGDATKQFMRQNGPLLSQHDHYGSLKAHIGETMSIRADKKMGLIPTFEYYVGDDAPRNEEAAWGWFLVKRGSAAFSVCFYDKVYELGDGIDAPLVTYKQVDLLEISQVLLGANPDAVQNALVRKALQEEVITKDFGEFILQDTGTGRHSIVVPELSTIQDLNQGMKILSKSLANLTAKLEETTGSSKSRGVKGPSTPGPVSRHVELLLRKEST